MATAPIRPIRPIRIRPCEPSTESLVAAIFDNVDYRDAFAVTDHGCNDVAEFATAYFLNQPRWLAALSMNLLKRQKLVDAVGDGSYRTGSAVGAWDVHGRSDDEIVFGDDMGFMEYCFSFRLQDDGSVEASTAVKYRWKRMSRLYFGLVKPMHRRFVPRSLRAVQLGTSQLAAS